MLQMKTEKLHDPKQFIDALWVSRLRYFDNERLDDTILLRAFGRTRKAAQAALLGEAATLRDRLDALVSAPGGN